MLMFRKSNKDDGEKIFRYSIRKYHFGAASVAVAALMFFANGTVQAQTPDISPATESEVARTSDIIGSSLVRTEALSEKTSGKNLNQLESSNQGNQESSDKNKSLVKDSEEGKKENQAEAISPVVDKSIAQSAQTSLQALLANLALDSMKELHARVEESLARAKAVLDNPNSSQEEVNAQVQVMKALTEEVNKALAGGLTSPAQLGEGGSATTSEVSPTPRRGRGRRGQLTPPAMLAPAENQEIKETTEEVTDYTNGQGNYPLSEKIHNLLQELKTSTENPEQVQKLKEAYDKLNEALGVSGDGLVDDAVFNAALEEYKKASQLQRGETRDRAIHRRTARSAVSLSLEKLIPGSGERPSRYPRDTVTDHEYQGSGLRFKAESTTKNIREITITGIEGLGLKSEISGLGTRKAILKLTGRIPKEQFGIREYVVQARDDGGFTKEYRGQIQLPAPKATFITTDEDLKGKADTIPQDPTFTDPSKYVRAKLPGPVDSRNRTNNQEVRVYLVKGGSTYDGYDTVVPYAKNFTILSSAIPNNKGVVTFTPPDYKKYGVDKLGTDSLRLVTMIVKSGTDTPLDSEGSISPLSDSTIRATVPVDRDGAIAELEQAATTKRESFDRIDHLTDEEKAEAVKKVNEALKEAKSNVGQATDKAGVNSAKNSGIQAITNVANPSPTTQSAPANLGNSTGSESPQGISESSVRPPVRSRRSVAFAGGAQSSQEKQVDKSVLRDLIQELETRLKDLDGIDQSVIDAAKIILGEGQAALRNTDLTEAGLREITAKVKEVLESLKGKQATKDEEEMQETSKEQGHLPYGTMIGSLLALLGLLLFLIARRKKESELKKLTKELTKVLQESNLTNVDVKVLDQAREALAQAVAFLANEKESDHTEDELIDKLKAILAQLR